MRKLIFLSSLFFTHLVFTQTWDGSILPTGNTYRTGNVGIGTDNPQARLHVQTNGEGSILSKSTENSGYGAANVIVDAASASYPGRFMFRESGVNRGWMDYLGGKINIRNGSGNALFTVLTSSGNIGIGATQPTAKLSIKDGGDGSGNGLLNFDWTYENNWGGDSNKFAGYIGFNAFRANEVAKDNYLRANAYTKRLAFEGGNNGFRWLAEDNVPNAGNSVSYLQLNELMVLKTNGYLGIGTSNPQFKLDVSGGSTVLSKYINFRDFDDEATSSTIISRDGHTMFWNGGAIVGQYSNNTLHNLNLSHGDLVVKKKIGIGTATLNQSQEILTVNGKILCEEVQVISDVTPDYVFETYYNGFSDLKPDYIMPTLAEIEAFTKANNHLPNVPSAKEIQENGLQLKEMTNILLQKIEELTLYTIEQEKRIKALEAKLEDKQ